MEGESPADGTKPASEGGGGTEGIAQLASEHIPKEVATTPSGLRLGGRPLVHSIHVTAIDGIFETASAENKEVTLEDVFREADIEDILWEARSGNKKLVELLNTQSEFDKLLTYAANDNKPFSPLVMKSAVASGEEQELIERHIKYVHLSCEILALEGTHFCIFNEQNFERIIKFLFKFVEYKGVVLTPHISAIGQVFVVQIPEVIISYLLRMDATNFVLGFITELHQPTVADLLLAVVGLMSPCPSKIKPKDPPSDKRLELTRQFNEWLGDAKFVTKLIETLTDAKKPVEASLHAADVMKEMIEVATRHIPRAQPPPPLFLQMTSGSSVAALVPAVLSLQNEQVFSAGVQVILELLKYEGLSSRPKRPPGAPGSGEETPAAAPATTTEGGSEGGAEAGAGGEEAEKAKTVTATTSDQPAASSVPLSPLLKYINDSVKQLIAKLQDPSPTSSSSSSATSSASASAPSEKQEKPRRMGGGLASHRGPPSTSTAETAAPAAPSSSSSSSSSNKPRRFGFLRLRVLGFCGRLIAHCAANPGHAFILQSFTNLNFWNIILDLFFSFVWNNFAHMVVERIIGVVFNASDEYKDLKMHVLVDCKLLDRIVDAAEGNRKDCEQPNGCRRGYMGSLTVISTNLQKAASKDAALNDVLSAHEGWQNYVKTSLTDIINIQETEASSFPLPTPGGAGRGRGRGGPRGGGDAGRGVRGGGVRGGGVGRPPGVPLRARGTGRAGDVGGRGGRGGRGGHFPEVEILVPVKPDDAGGSDVQQ